MRNFTANKPIHVVAGGGTSANYLVRSTANNSVSHGPQISQPASKGQLKRLLSLTQKELLQNIEVQQSLRSAMTKIQKESLLLQNPDSTIKFATDREKHRCHKAVSRIRRDVFRTGPLVSSDSEKNAVESSGSFMRERSFDRMKNSSPDKTTHSRRRSRFVTPRAMAKSGTCKIGMSTANTTQCSLPAISPPVKVKSPVEEDQHRPASRHSLPLLDANSRFGIMRRTSELRSIRLSKTTNQNQANLGQLKNDRVFPNCPRIEIFANNFKLLNSREIEREERPSNKLKFLDSTSFNQIDCDDYLHVKNRLDNLSPIPTVLDHRKYWSSAKKSS